MTRAPLRSQRGAGAARLEAGRVTASANAASLVSGGNALAGAGPTKQSAAAGSARAFASGASAGMAPYSHTPPGRHHLFVPGPTNVPDRVLRVMDRQSGACEQTACDAARAKLPARARRKPPRPSLLHLGYRGADGAQAAVQDDERPVLCVPWCATSGSSRRGACLRTHPLSRAATGTGAWEAGLTNTLSPGDSVVCFRYGQFSHLWVDQAQRLGLDVTVLDEEWGRGADEARLRSVLEGDKGKKIKAVMVVHNETTTGVTSDIAKCRAAMDAAGHPALLLVDGVSSIGACDFRFDEWRVDVAMTGSQKALSLPTGLALCCVSPKALEASKTAKLPRVFFSFADMAKFNATGGFPVRSLAQSCAHPSLIP